MTDEGPLTAFEKLLGREAKPAEREQLYRVKEALGLRDNDAIWLVLFALQYYDSLYRQFPKAIGQEAARILGDTRAAADASMRASLERAKADLTRSMAIAAEGVARSAARRRTIQWLVAGMVLGAALFGGGVLVGRML